MRYVGGKVRIAKWVAAEIAKLKKERTIYIEPFLGAGASFVQNAPLFKELYASDIHVDLMLLWQALKDGWEPPDFISKEEYLELKDSPPSALRGFAGFGCVFSGKWFGGYIYQDMLNGKPYMNPFPVAARTSLLRDLKAVGKAELFCCSYDDWIIDNPTQTVVYCDPPYQGTIDYKGTPPFDHDKFWNWATNESLKGTLVIVSEASFPSDWKPIAVRGRKALLGKYENEGREKRVEGLFVHEKFAA